MDKWAGRQNDENATMEQNKEKEWKEMRTNKRPQVNIKYTNTHTMSWKKQKQKKQERKGLRILGEITAASLALKEIVTQVWEVQRFLGRINQRGTPQET